MSGRSSSSDSSDIEDVITLLVTYMVDEYNTNFFIKQPYRNDSLTGREYVLNVLEGHTDRCLDLFRMRTDVLYDLSDALQARGLLRDTRYVKVEEQLCIFLYIIGHNETNRNVADRFQHSPETISRHFGTVLKAICKFAKEVILPPNFEEIHPYLRSRGDKYWPWFKNCVGAIDGTHINASVPAGKAQIPYRGRKTQPTQNVMCACDFNMCFTYVLAGWEGTANDSRIFAEAITNPDLKFPHPPEGKYYLVDSGYPKTYGFMTPYKGERYHLNDYRGNNRSPRTAKEQFNYAHSSLRNVIERCFGVLKARFPILKLMAPYSLRKQRNMVIAACVIHNFIRRHNLDDDFFTFYQNDDMDVPGEGGDDGNGGPTHGNSTQRGQRDIEAVRDRIKNSMATHYHLPA